MKEVAFWEPVATNNKARVNGLLEHKFEYSHQNPYEILYKNRVLVMRTSGTIDRIPIIVPESLMTSKMREASETTLTRIEVVGKFYSHNEFDAEGKKHIYVYLYAKSAIAYKYENGLDLELDENEIFLKGKICKGPFYRVIPYSKKEICEGVVAVPRSYRQDSYIPCIAWNKNAYRMSRLFVGTELEIHGRIQSRDYFKKVVDDWGDENYLQNTTYEVCIRDMKVKYK